jgi:hypothetical protein
VLGKYQEERKRGGMGGEVGEFSSTNRYEMKTMPEKVMKQSTEL